MTLHQIAELLAVPVTFLTGAKGKPKLKIVRGGRADPPKKKEPPPETGK